jgi:hypothetical protein
LVANVSNVLAIETISEIRVALERGDGIRAISRRYGISTNTVARYRKEGVLCACGRAFHAGLCKQKVAITPGIVSYHRRRKGVDDGYQQPVRHSRQARSTEKLLFVFGFLPDWEKRAKRPSEFERYGIIGEVERVTTKVRWVYRADVRQEMMLACFEGRLLREEIAAFVGKFVMFEMMRYLGHRISRYTSVFDPIKGRGDKHEMTLLDMMAQEITDDEDMWSWGARQTFHQTKLTSGEVHPQGLRNYTLRDHA